MARALEQIGLIGKIFIAFCIASIGLITFVSWTGDSATTYNLQNTQNLSTYDISVSLANKQSNIKQSMDEEVITETDNPLSQWKGAMNAFKILFGTTDDMQNFTASAIEDTHLPVQFNLILLIIAIMIIIAIISALLKWVI